MMADGMADAAADVATGATEDRSAWMGILAKALPARLAALWDEAPSYRVLRAPEVGTVMLRGRTGGTGAPFNLGEMSVTRCAVQLEGGAVGHSVVPGRDKGHARRAALLDALLQGPGAAGLRARVLVPLQAEAAAARDARAARAAATQVEFFTLVRGED